MIFIRALVFGVTLAIAIGPIALLIIRYAVTDGLHAGLLSASGAALADLTYAVVALSIGAAVTPLLAAHATQTHTATSIALIAFGIWLVWTAVRPQPLAVGAKEMPTGAARRSAPLLTTYALTMANPLTVVAFLAFLGQLPPDASPAARVTAAAGLFAGSLCVQVVLASGGAALGRILVAGRGIQVLNVSSGMGIVLFGLIGLFR